MRTLDGKILSQTVAFRVETAGKEIVKVPSPIIRIDKC